MQVLEMAFFVIHSPVPVVALTLSQGPFKLEECGVEIHAPRPDGILQFHTPLSR